MKKKYTRNEFENFDFDTKCIIFEAMLTNEYFTGQSKIFNKGVEQSNTELKYYSSEVDFDNIEIDLNSVSKEQKEIEMNQFKDLLKDLTDLMFSKNEIVELDIDKLYD